MPTEVHAHQGSRQSGNTLMAVALLKGLLSMGCDALYIGYSKTLVSDVARRYELYPNQVCHWSPSVAALRPYRTYILDDTYFFESLPFVGSNPVEFLRNRQRVFSEPCQIFVFN
jgi:hypothetical protein